MLGLATKADIAEIKALLVAKTDKGKEVSVVKSLWSLFDDFITRYEEDMDALKQALANIATAITNLQTAVTNGVIVPNTEVAALTTQAQGFADAITALIPKA